MAKKATYQLPENVIHYKAEVPELCDQFWALLVVILQEYFEDPDNFKIAIFTDNLTPRIVYKLLLGLKLKIEVTWPPRGNTPAHQDKRCATLEKFAKQKDGILVVNSWTIADGLSLPCRQAIELGASVSGLDGTSRRMHMLQKASESAGKNGRFITIFTPHEIEHKDMHSGLATAIQAARSYQINLLENTNLFRQRFNQTIHDAFAGLPTGTLVPHYISALKRRRYQLADMNQESIASLQELHRCAVVMALSFSEVSTMDKEKLVTSPVKISPPWLAAGGISSMYEDPALQETRRVLYLMTTDPSTLSMPVRSKAALPMIETFYESPGTEQTAEKEDTLIDLTMDD